MSPLLPEEVLRGYPATLQPRAYYDSVVLGVLRLVWRRRWLVFLIVATALLASLIASFVMTKRYTADAIIQIDPGRADQGASVDRTANLVLDAAAVVESEARILKSRAIARRVVARLQLTEDPRFVPRARTEPSLDDWGRRLVDWASAATAHGGQTSSGPAEQSGGTPGPFVADQVARDLLKNLDIQNDSRSYLITVAFTAPDPELAANVANGFVDEYLQARLEGRLKAATSLSEWLFTQLRDARVTLQAAEQDVQAFRELAGVADTGNETTSVLQQRLRDLTSQLSAANANRMAEEARLRRVREMVESGQLPLVADLAGSPMLQRYIENEAAARRELTDLSARYGDRHPEIIRAKASLREAQARVSSEADRAISAVEAQAGAAYAAEELLAGQVQELSRLRIEGKRNEAQLRDLQASADAVRDRVRSLSESYEQALALKELRPLNARQVVRAETVPLPSGPNRMLVVGLPTLLAAAGAVVLVILLERRDVGFRTAAELRAATDHRCIAMVPWMPLARGTPFKCPEKTSGAAESGFWEAIRSVIVSAELGRGSPGKVVLITSSIPGEGKSSLVAALAAALVASDIRVLVIDGQPGRHDPGSEGDAPVLESILAGTGGAKAFFAARAGEPLVTIRRSSGFRDGQRLLTSATFEAMLNEARARFDVILIEGPPVLLSAESFVIARQADSTIHVTRWHVTKRKTVSAALDRFKEMSTRLNGLVLTSVDMRQHRKYLFMDDCYFYNRYWRFYRTA